MLFNSKFSPFPKEWADGTEGILIRGGLALVAIGTTGYILNKVFNSASVIASPEEIPTTDNTLNNRPYSAAVKEHLRATYAHVAGGLVMTSGFAYLFHCTGWSMRLMIANKWISIGGTLLLSFGSGIATRLIDQHQHPVWKYIAWTLFNSSFGIALSPLCQLESNLLARAALLSTGVVSTISAVGMTVQREQYLWLGAPLMIGVTVVCLASISSTILPATATTSLSISEFISLYGGLFVFSGVLLFDTQKMIANAENNQDARRLSPIDESLDVYLDSLNIFVRILALLSNEDERKKKRSTATK